jgi:hypothetical protein
MLYATARAAGRAFWRPRRPWAALPLFHRDSETAEKCNLAATRFAKFVASAAKTSPAKTQGNKKGPAACMRCCMTCGRPVNRSIGPAWLETLRANAARIARQEVARTASRVIRIARGPGRRSRGKFVFAARVAALISVRMALGRSTARRHGFLGHWATTFRGIAAGRAARSARVASAVRASSTAATAATRPLIPVRARPAAAPAEQTVDTTASAAAGQAHECQQQKSRTFHDRL